MFRSGRLGWNVTRQPAWWTLNGTISGWEGTGSAPENVCVGAYRSKGVSSLELAKINLANPDKHNLFGVDPEFSSLVGFVFNGTTHRLDTGIIPSSGYSIVVFVSGITKNENISDISACGQETFGSRTVVLPKLSHDLCGFKIGSSGIGIGSPIETGSMSICGGLTYVNGVSTGQPEIAIGTPTLSLTIGASKKPSGYSYGECNIAFVAIYNFVLSPEQNFSLHVKMSNL